MTATAKGQEKEQAATATSVAKQTTKQLTATVRSTNGSESVNYVLTGSPPLDVVQPANSGVYLEHGWCPGAIFFPIFGDLWGPVRMSVS